MIKVWRKNQKWGSILWTFLDQFGLVSSLKRKNKSIETMINLFVTKLSFLFCLLQCLTNVRRHKFVANGLCRAGRGKSDIELTAWATPCHHEHLFKQRQNGERSSKLIMQGSYQIWMRIQFCKESDLASIYHYWANFGKQAHLQKYTFTQMIILSSFIKRATISSIEQCYIDSGDQMISLSLSDWSGDHWVGQKRLIFIRGDPYEWCQSCLWPPKCKGKAFF